jgi:hypothetical protein
VPVFAPRSRLHERGGTGHGEEGTASRIRGGCGDDLPGVRGDKPTVTLDVVNLARVPHQTLLAAEAVATEVYRAIGVRVVWTDKADAAAAGRLSVVLVAEPGESRILADAPGWVTVGVAPPNAGRVYVFCTRIADLARRKDRSVELVLGRVLAHEVGHQLLPGQGHSDAGIMREKLDYRSPTAPTFTAQQAESIRTLLAATTQARGEANTVTANSVRPRR